MSAASSRKYRMENAELVRKKDRERVKLRRAADPAAYQKTQRESRRKLRKEVIAAYGGRCSCCNEDRQEFLAIDHVFGDGCKERKQLNIRGGDFHRWLRKQGYPKDRYRLLCHNCNQAIGWYGYCPHQREKEAACG